MLFFAFFSISKKQNIKRNETFGIMIFQPNETQETWTLLQAVPEEVTRVEGAPQGAPPASWPLCCSTDVLLPPIYTYVPPSDQKRSQKTNSTAATFYIHEILSWSLFRSSAEGGNPSPVAIFIIPVLSMTRRE